MLSCLQCQSGTPEPDLRRILRRSRPSSGDWSNQAWVLKNSTFLEKSQNSGDPKCLEIREDRLQRILTQFHFRQFSEKEFFNSHKRYHQQRRTSRDPGGGQCDCDVVPTMLTGGYRVNPSPR